MLDLVEFSLDLGMVGRKRDEAGKSMGSISIAPLLDEPPRGCGEEDHTDGENETPNELKGDGELPRSTSGPILGDIVDDGCKKETDGDRPLVTGDESAAVLIVFVSDRVVIVYD